MRHVSTREDLDAIERSIATRHMPPLRYRLLHPGSRLTENEVKAVRDWVRYGKSQLDTKYLAGDVCCEVTLTFR